MEGQIKQIHELGVEITDAFAGLVPEKWMNLYARDRREALEEELREIRRLAEV